MSATIAVLSIVVLGLLLALTYVVNLLLTRKYPVVQAAAEIPPPKPKKVCCGTCAHFDVETFAGSVAANPAFARACGYRTPKQMFHASEEVIPARAQWKDMGVCRLSIVSGADNEAEARYSGSSCPKYELKEDD